MHKLLKHPDIKQWFLHNTNFDEKDGCTRTISCLNLINIKIRILLYKKICIEDNNFRSDSPIFTNNNVIKYWH